MDNTLKNLEFEFKKAIELEKKSAIQNEAKIKASTIKGITYEQYSDIVKTAHLKPINAPVQIGDSEKKDRV